MKLRKTAASKNPSKTALFPRVRVCLHCGATQSAYMRKPLEPIILSISLLVYYPAERGKQLRATPKLSMCEKCTLRAIAGSPRVPRAESVTLLNAVRERLADSYNTMLEIDQA